MASRTIAFGKICRVFIRCARCKSRGIRQQKPYSSKSNSNSLSPIHPDLLKVLVCPLSKEPLRFDAENNELVCDRLGVAYPILDSSVPNLVPQDGRLLKAGHTDTDTDSK